MNKLSPAKKASQLLFPAFRFGETDPLDAQRLVDLGVGGFCIYGGTPPEIRSLTQKLQRKADIPLLFCADYEDGIATHVKEGTEFPSNMALGAAGQEKLAYQKAIITAREAKAMGVDWILSPVVDLATHSENPIVNLRSFGRDPKLVCSMAGAYLKGLKISGALGCLKHFPGHGETPLDSHLTLPTLDIPLMTLHKRELEPFYRLGEIAGSVMLGHLRVKAMDSSLPASMSSKIVSDFLRKKINFSGLAVTDALSMLAISQRYSPERVAQCAIKARVDVLLCPEDPFSFHRILLNTVDKHGLFPWVEDACKRIAHAKEQLGLFKTGGLVPEKDLRFIGSYSHQVAAKEMAEAALSWDMKPRKSLLKANYLVSYLEPEAESSRDWMGTVFVNTLKEGGVRVVPWGPQSHSRILVIGSFISPRAYSGKIELDKFELDKVRHALSRSVMGLGVSFGSPFVFRKIKNLSLSLCAFSDSEDSQRAAALAILGQKKVSGKMPV